MGDVAKAALDDYRSAPIDERLRAALGFVAKLTADPAGLEPADLAPLRAVGICDAAIEEIIEVAFVFNVVDRLADALDFPLSTERELSWIARLLTKAGYEEAGVL